MRFDPSLAYGALVLGLAVLFWAVKQFFGRVLQELGSKFTGLFTTRLSVGRVLGRRALRRYRRAVQANYAEHRLGFIEQDTVDVRQIYVPLEYEADGRRVDVYADFRRQPRAVVVGRPGAGKSLLLKNSMLLWAADTRLHAKYLPVIVELHRCNGNEKALVDLVEHELTLNQLRKGRPFVEKALADGLLSVLFDGLDEVARDDQERVVGMLRDFAREYDKCQVVVTCRSAVYHGQLGPEFGYTVQVADFDDASIRRFLARWPGLARDEADRLFVQLQNSPQLMLLAASPLLLTMIAYLHTEVFAKSGRSLPNSRPAFYDIAIDHLLRRDRDLARHPKLAVYDAGDKKAVLQRVALALQEAPAEQADRRSIEHIKLIAVVKALLPDLNLAPERATDLIDETVERSQLMVRLDRRSSRYAFRHLTLQEYLSAVELAGDPRRLLERYRADPDAWRETVKLWCGASTQDCTPVVEEIFADGGEMLALECLAEAKRIDDGFARKVIGSAIGRLGDHSADRRAAISALGAVAADARPRGRYVFDLLTAVALSSDVGRSDAMWALAATRLPAAGHLLAGLASDDEARAAMVSMGEQAIPALRGEAGRGGVQAVDDLAAVGTPAAAEALATLLWLDDRPVAVRAAWRLANLIQGRDIEAALRLSSTDLMGNAEVPTMEEVWAPFREPGDGLLPVVMGRVAWLLDSSQAEEIPTDLNRIDARLAIPIGVARGAEKSRRKGNTPPRQVLRLATELGHYRARTWEEVSDIVSDVEDDVLALDMLRNRILAHHRVPMLQLTTINLLEPRVRTATAVLFVRNRTSRATMRQWAKVREQPRDPAAWSIFLSGLWFILDLAVLYFGFGRIVDATTALWPWGGPTWLSKAAAAAGVGAIVAALLGLRLRRSSRRRQHHSDADSRANPWNNPIFSGSLIRAFGVEGAVIYLGLGVFSVVAFVEWIGWWRALAIGVPVLAVLGLLNLLVERRKTALDNPLRELYDLHSKTSAAGRSIIAG